MALAPRVFLTAEQIQNRVRAMGSQISADFAGEPVILVDDILRGGNKLSQLKRLLESHGAQVIALAVIIYQPNPQMHDFGSLPLYYLAKLEASYYADGAHCELCKRGLPLETVWT